MNKILAHRGYWEIAPENTRLAFDAARIFGFNGIEVDVHLTKDNELVIIHDEDVRRTSDGSGKIKDLTLKELKELNFSSQFNNSFPKQKIMTYKELLIEYGSVFNVINVEIKTNIFRYKGIEKIIWETHQKIKPKAKIIYSSFNFDSLIEMNKISQKAILGFLFVNDKDCYGKEDKIKEICTYINPWFKSVLRKKSLDFYNSLNLPLILWSFDKRKKFDKWTKGSNKIFEKIPKIKNVEYLISNSKF